MSAPEPGTATFHPAKMAQLGYAFSEQRRIALSYLTTIQGHYIRAAVSFYALPAELRADNRIVSDNIFYFFERKPAATSAEPDEQPLVMSLLFNILDFVNKPFADFTRADSMADFTSKFQALMPLYFFLYTEVVMVDIDLLVLGSRYGADTFDKEPLVRWARGVHGIKMLLQSGELEDADKPIIERLRVLLNNWERASTLAYLREREGGRTFKPEYHEDHILSALTFVTTRAWRQLGRRLGIRDAEEDRNDFGPQETDDDTRLA